MRFSIAHYDDLFFNQNTVFAKHVYNLSPHGRVVNCHQEAQGLAGRYKTGMAFIYYAAKFCKAPIVQLVLCKKYIQHLWFKVRRHGKYQSQTAVDIQLPFDDRAGVCTICFGQVWQRDIEPIALVTFLQQVSLNYLINYLLQPSQVCQHCGYI